MLKSTYTPPPPLPPGWTEHRAPSGHVYYYNAETKQSTYQRPTAPPPEQHPTIQPQYSATFPSIFPAGPPFGHPPIYGSATYDRPKRGGERRRHDRRQLEDRPKSKHAIPGCEPWVLVKTKLGRRFVHNPETNESFWKFPQDVLKGVIEYDRIEREKRERRERGEPSESEGEKPEEREKVSGTDDRPQRADTASDANSDMESDEYEEVEVTDDEEQDLPSKKPRTDEGDDKPLEFNEEDIAYQLAAMGEEYGLDPGEYGEPGEEGWEEGAEGLPLTEEDAVALFRDLLDDFRINPYTPFERIIEEGRIVDDSRYTVLPNMKSRRAVWADWSRDRIQERKEQKEKEEKKDPRIRYLALLQEHATPKLYWAEFKRKYRKAPEMKDTRISDKEKEKYYRDHIDRLKLPEATRKSDLSALLKSIPLQQLNRSSTTDTLPPAILTDLRYISLPPQVRDPIIEAYISTLEPPPEETGISAKDKEERLKKEKDRQRREKALAEREKRVQEEKRKQRRDMMHGKDLLRQEDEEIQKAMRVGKEGLKSYMEEVGQQQ
ncbi:hypothetical protein VTO42DRAFT_8145 [Malbranchea cinnamomea]